MTTTSIPGSSSGPATPASGSSSSGGGIVRLNPFDGLFLRAEHLEQLQAYARELTHALGQAGGTGVVHGYGVTLSTANRTLNVSGGLAFDPDGRPLRMTTPTSVKLDPFTAAGGVWVIELVAKDDPFGDETVFGALCEDPCDGADASTRPYVAEHVEVRLHRFDPGATGGAKPTERRSRVAKAWFAAERSEAGALVVAASQQNPGQDGNFSAAAWSLPTDLPRSEVPGGFAEPGTVPIGILLRVEDAWVLDTWTARRDRIDTPPRRAWEGRLGMRPWDVFVAQVLQFQVQLAEEWPRAAATLAGLASRLLAIEELDDALKTLRSGLRGGVTKLVASATERLKGQVVGAAGGVGTLLDLGFVELPPAGFLPLPDGEGWTGMSVEEKVATLFGSSAELHFCACRPDVVAHAVAEAQHLDRIPLTGGGPKPEVDILVPTDSGTWSGPSYKWVAFHRRRDRDCRSETVHDLVDVYLHTAADAESLLDDLRQGRRPETLPEPRTVRYPVGGWAMPEIDVQRAVDEATAKPRQVWVVGLTESPQRARLIWVRAVLLVNKFLDEVNPGPTIAFTAVIDLPSREEIHVLAPAPIVIG
jgi:hypothetical protein